MNGTAETPAPFGTTSILQLGGAAALAGLAIRRGLNPDAPALLTAALTLFIAAVVAGFARRHLRADPYRGRFFVDVAAFTLSVLSMVLAGDLITFAIGWVLSGRVLVGLVGHVRHWDEARAAAARASRAFLVSDTAIVLAAIVTVGLTGTTAIVPAIATLAGLGTLASTLVSALVLVAAMARCALPPFAKWLLGSLSTPTPVSALMHGGFVNAGGFLLIRFGPVLEAAPAVQLAAVLIGLGAAVYGILVMSVRPDVKGSLAASTVSQMGFMIASCGLGFYAAALWHLVAHGLFKAWLFLTSGSCIGIEQYRPQVEMTPFAAAIVAIVTLCAGDRKSVV